MLPASHHLRRSKPRAPEDRQEGYDEEYDDRTIFYDVFRHDGDTVLSGPPLFNLTEAVAGADIRVDGSPVPANSRHLSDLDRTQRSLLRGITGSELALAGVTEPPLVATIGDDHRPLFEGHRAVVTLVREAQAEMLREWASFHHREQGVTAALLYVSDQDAEPGQLLDAVEAAGMDSAVVVTWRFPYGPDGGPRSRWDSDFSYYSVLEHARMRFLQRAAGVLNLAACELVLTDDGRTVFQHAESAPRHVLRFGSRWVEGATDVNRQTGDPRRFTDYRHHRNMTSPPRWVVVPDAQTSTAQWRIQSVGDTPAPRSLRVLGRKFRNLGNLAAPDREVDADVDRPDRLLGEAMDRRLSVSRTADVAHDKREEVELDHRPSLRRRMAAAVKTLQGAGAQRTHSPEDLQYLFIMTYGRTGSTLLQGILSSIPGYLIRGENRAMMYSLFTFHRTSVKERQRLMRPEQLASTHPFYGIDGYPDEVAFSDIRRLALDTILRPEPNTRVVGFKEIRWFQKDLVDYVEFLRNVFPGARFIVNTRDHEEVAKSKWWGNRDDALTEIADREGRIMTAAEALGDAAYHVHYNDYVTDPEKLSGMFRWLGEPFDVKTVRNTLARPHSY